MQNISPLSIRAHKNDPLQIETYQKLNYNILYNSKTLYKIEFHTS